LFLREPDMRLLLRRSNPPRLTRGMRQRHGIVMRYEILLRRQDSAGVGFDRPGRAAMREISAC
jgi:hypothetical protein